MGIPATLSSVPAQTPYIQYVATNNQTVFPYPFEITQDSDLVVVINGVTQATDSGYTLSGVGNSTGGNLTFTSGRTSGDIVTLYRDIAIERISQIAQNSGFSSTTFNVEFNQIYLILQQLAQAAAPNGFSLQVPNTNNPAPTTMLTPAAYANKYLAFDSNGNPTPALLTNSGALTLAILAGLLWPQTAAETAAGATVVNEVYAVYDLRRYGGDPTGAAASDTAMTAAIALASYTGGGTIRAPANTVAGDKYVFNSPISLNQKSSIVIEGDGGPGQNAGPATVFSYTGTGSTHWIQLTSASGCGLRRIKLVNSNNSFTGALVRCGNDGSHGDSVFCFLDDCTLDSTSTGPYHLDLDQADTCYFNGCLFQNGATSVKGQNSAGGSHSNAITFTNCTWQSQTAVPVNYGGEDWSFINCTFEELSNLEAGAFANSLTTATNSLTFEGCWFGDATVGGGTWVTYVGNGFNFTGNFISNEQSNTTALSLTVSGCVITGNTFSTLATGINFAGGSDGIVIQGNDFQSVTTPLSNAANMALTSVMNPNHPLLTNTSIFDPATNGLEYSPNGKLDQWFVTNVSNGANSVSFPTPFPNNCFNVIATLGTHQSTSAVCYVSALSKTGFTLTVSDSAGTDTAYIRAVGN